MFPPQKLKLKQILSDAILLLCRSALPFDSELSIQALIGVTCDQSDICLVSIEEVIKKSAADSHAEDKLNSSSIGSSQTNSTLWIGSNDDLTLSSSPPAEGSSQNTNFITEKYRARRIKLPASDKSICSGDIKSARSGNYDNCDVDSVVISKRQRLEQSISQTASRHELKMETNHSKWRHSRVPLFCNSDQILQLELQKQQLSDSTQTYSSVYERSKRSSTDAKLMEHDTFSSESTEIKIEPTVEGDEEEASVKEEYAEVSFTDHFQDDGSQFSLDGTCPAPCQLPMNYKNFNFQQSQESSILMPMNGNVSDANQQLQLNVSISTLICQQVLKYEGPFVTVRDIQRRRLRQVSANHIKSSMNQLTVDGLGFYKTLCLGIMVFYKCPPTIIDPDILQKYNVSHEHYEQLYNQRSYITSANRHSDNYWERITMASPYTEETVR